MRPRDLGGALYSTHKPDLQQGKSDAEVKCFAKCLYLRDQAQIHTQTGLILQLMLSSTKYIFFPTIAIYIVTHYVY